MQKTPSAPCRFVSQFVKYRQIVSRRNAMPKKKKISEIKLALSEKQRLCLKSDSATPEGLGVKKAEYNRWYKEPLFSVVDELIDYGHINRDSIDEELPPIKAAVLCFLGFSYTEIEAHLGLESDTVLSWTHSENEDDTAEMFSRALEQIQESNRKPREPRETDDWDKRDMMIPLILQGKNNQEIADELGVSRQTVSYWRNHDDDFKDELRTEIRAYRDRQRAKFAQVLDKAYQSLEALLDSQDPAIKLKAAVEILKSSNK